MHNGGSEAGLQQRDRRGPAISAQYVTPDNQSINQLMKKEE